MIHLYGITTCSTVKQARQWLAKAGIAYHFHDLRAGTLQQNLLQEWLAQLGQKTLINTRSTTWRSLPPSSQQQALSSDPWPVLLAHPSLLKRPILVHPQGLHCGFKAQDYALIFNIH